MAWILTGTGWAIIGVVTGWHAADFVADADRLPRSACVVLGALGGLAGGGVIGLLGVAPSDPGWILSMITCTFGAVGAVVFATACISLHRSGVVGRKPDSRTVRESVIRRETIMITIGVILVIVGFIFEIPIVWTLGIIALAVGLVLVVAGALGHAVGGRRHWY